MRWNDRIGRRIKLSDLHILVAVAQSGSMAKAASELAVSHPVISRSISDLEHTLGVRLLERNPRGVELTEFGRAMLNRSHAAFDELRQGVKEIEFLSDPTRRRGADRSQPATGGQFRLRGHRPAVPALPAHRVPCRLGRNQSIGPAAESDRAGGRSADLPKRPDRGRRTNQLRIPVRQPLRRGSGCEQPLGQAAAHRACGLDE